MSTIQLHAIPKLRFSEFYNNWNLMKLGDLSKNVMYGLNSSAIPYDGENGYIRITDIDDENHGFIPNPITSPDGKLNDKYCLTVGDLVVARTGATTGKSYLYKKNDGKLYFAGFLIKLSIVHAHALFVYFNTFTDKYARWVTVMSMRSGQPGINAEEYKSFLLYVPEMDEQHKIANFISSVDKKIQQLSEKKSLLQQYKKGIMQKLFSQDIRFKDELRNDFPDWKEKTLAEVLIPQIREVKKPTEKYLAIGIRSHMKGTFQKPDSDPEAIAMEKLFIVKENDLVVNITFAWEGAVAIVKKEDDGGLVSHRFPAYSFKKDQATHDFFRHIIMQKRFKYMLDVISPGGAGRNRVLSKKEFLKLKWVLPSVAEQNKIASFLGELDKKIAYVGEQIDLTKTFKKGLLQQMFP